MCQVPLQFIVGCVQSSSNEITLLETDSTDYITAAQMQYGIASVRSAEISGFDSKAFFKFITENKRLYAGRPLDCECIGKVCIQFTLDFRESSMKRNYAIIVKHSL